jgi:hypothetical protein
MAEVGLVKAKIKMAALAQQTLAVVAVVEQTLAGFQDTQEALA